MRKYRHELKFIISTQMAEILKQRLSLIMDVDTHSIYEDNTYLNRSLYFDDIKSTAYYEKLDGVEFRKKYRIRIYNGDDSFIRLECKYKHNNMTSKDQVRIDKTMCEQIVNGSSHISSAPHHMWLMATTLDSTTVDLLTVSGLPGD